MRRSEEEIARLHAEHYGALVRLGTLLLHDVGAAEEVVQDAFVATYSAWWRLREPDAATSYLRRAVVNGARSRLRRRGLQERHDREVVPQHVASAETDGLAGLARESVLTAIARLPRRQREVVYLRYYLDLSEAEIAEILNISNGSVKTHASRAAAALRLDLEGVRR